MDIVSAEKVEKGNLFIFWLGQGGFVFKTDKGKTLMVDPLLSFSAMKDGMTYIHNDFSLDPSKTKVDYVFCTHDHSDHTDIETLLPLSRANPLSKFFGPLESYERMKKKGIPENNIEVVSLKTQVNIDGIKVKTVYAECTDDKCITHYGYFFNFNSIKVYITGDTKKGLNKYINKVEWVIKEKADILIVCINEKFNNLGPEDAAKLAAFINPKVVIPMHYDCFVENTIDPRNFIDALNPRLRDKVVLMKYGGEYIYRLKR